MRTLLFLLLIVPGILFGQITHTPVYDVTYPIISGTITEKVYSGSQKYIEYIPDGEPKGIILALHGLGERGTDLSAVYSRMPIATQIKNGSQPEYIIIIPQLSSASTSWPKNVLLQLFKIVDSYKKDFKIVTGLSLGGMGSFGAINHAYEYNGNKSDYWDAAAIVCGSTTLLQKKENLAHDSAVFGITKIKAYHGTGDGTVSIGPIRAFRDRYLQYQLRGSFELVEYTGAGHSIWNRVYDPKTVEGFWNWVKDIEPIPGPMPINELVKAMWWDGKVIRAVTERDTELIIQASEAEK